MADNEPVILNIETPNAQKDGTDVDFDGEIEDKKGAEVDFDSVLLKKNGIDIATDAPENPKTI